MGSLADSSSNGTQTAAYGRNQPLGMSGEWLLYPNTSHSDGNIQNLLSGCF